VKRAKQKPLLPPRNPLVAVALLRKSGAHSKTRKALRRKSKVDTQQQTKNEEP
jgi:hypothetical protein